jgi:alkyl hydroperoxide reductase subunit AhpC
MSLRLGDIAPNFTADTTHGMINFYEWMNHQMTILFSYSADFSSDCTAELSWLVQHRAQFEKRNIGLLGLNTGNLVEHQKFISSIAAACGAADADFPLISDKNMRIAKLYGMHHSKALEPSAARSLYIISADKKILLSWTYPLGVQRNFEELLRVIDVLRAQGIDFLREAVA